jgi:hypothetical protein
MAAVAGTVVPLVPRRPQVSRERLTSYIQVLRVVQAALVLLRRLPQPEARPQRRFRLSNVPVARAVVAQAVLPQAITAVPVQQAAIARRSTVF